MRFLGWMHNKIRDTNIEPFKDFKIGNYCACLSAKTPLDDQVSHIRPRFDSRHEARENNLSEVEAKKAEGNCEDETSMVIPDLFHGFLAIGTLGSEYGTSEPATPTFPRSLENIADEKIEVTENDLKVLKDETRKFLDTEAEAEEDCNESLGRNSCISTITLGGMQMKGAKADDYVKVAPCPLQGYLFGSLRELPETTVELEKEKASPGEVFQRKKLTDETSAETEGKREMHAKKAHKSAKHLIKKILRKFHPSRSPAPPSTNEAASSVSTKKKLNKVLRMLHRQVHPENSLAEEEFIEFHKENIKALGHNADLASENEDNRKFLTESKSMERIQRYKNDFQYGLSGSNINGNGEYWIKTDADCKY
uniref:Protein LAZY 1 n=1 Tax=Manihot esculenta TaxID=3983 RepID=A0A2C9W0S1_MANES